MKKKTKKTALMFKATQIESIAIFKEQKFRSHRKVFKLSWTLELVNIKKMF